MARYSVTGDHPVLKRPDIYNVSKEEAEHYCNVLAEYGYKNIKMQVIDEKASEKET